MPVEVAQWRSQGHSFVGGGGGGASHPRGSGGMLSREILKSRVPQVRFPAFCG